MSTRAIMALQVARARGLPDLMVGYLEEQLTAVASIGAVADAMLDATRSHVALAGRLHAAAS